MKQLRMLIILFGAVLLFTGCQGNTNKEGRGTDRNNTIQPTRYNDQGTNMNRTQNINRDGNIDQVRNDRNRDQQNRNNNDRYDVADEAADRITSELDEVNRAYVLTTNNNAYVAVTMDADRGNDSQTNRRGTTDNDQNRRGMADNERTRNITNSTMDGGDDHISEDLKRKISDIVRSVDQNIDNVYVSTNPDFVDLTNNYINDVNAGHPVRGFFDEMGNMIERIFPQNR